MRSRTAGSGLDGYFGDGRWIRHPLRFSHAAGLAVFTDSWATLKKLPAAEAAVMDNLIALDASSPSARQKCDVAVEPLLTHRTDPRLDRERLRLDALINSAYSHRRVSIEKQAPSGKRVER